MAERLEHYYFVYSYIRYGLRHQISSNIIMMFCFRNVCRLGLSQNWIGGSSLAWIHQHVVQHHIHTNDLHNDPDITGILLT